MVSNFIMHRLVIVDLVVIAGPEFCYAGYQRHINFIAISKTYIGKCVEGAAGASTTYSCNKLHICLAAGAPQQICMVDGYAGVFTET